MSTTQHPLTEAAAVEMWDASPCPEGYEFRGMLTVEQDATLYAMRAAFDAGREHERANPEDARPWELLKEGDPLHVGDEVRQDLRGITRIAVVGRVDGEGDPWTAESDFIGEINDGTWYVRRPVQELPEEDGAVIVPAEGHEYIETQTGKKSRRLTWDAECLVWYDARGTHLHGDITPGTWKLEGQ